MKPRMYQITVRISDARIAQVLVVIEHGDGEWAGANMLDQAELTVSPIRAACYEAWLQLGGAAGALHGKWASVNAFELDIEKVLYLK